MLINFKSTSTQKIIKDNEFENKKRKLGIAIRTAIGSRSVNQFVRNCKMIDNNLILDLMNEKISILPDKQNLKTIANASEGRITYTYLCEVCGYSEIELSSNFTWRNFYPERGCIYYIDLGTNTIGFEQKGIRPCVIISNDKGNRAGGIVTVAPITSQGKNKIPSHVYITKQDGMKENSTILIEQTRVVDKRRFFYNGTPIKILQLSEQKISEVNTAIEIQFGLENVIYNEEIAFKLIDQINALKQNENINKKLVELLDEKIDELINYCSKYNKNYKAVIEEYNIINNYSFAI